MHFSIAIMSSFYSTVFWVSLHESVLVSAGCDFRSQCEQPNKNVSLFLFYALCRCYEFRFIRFDKRNLILKKLIHVDSDLKK